MKKVKLKKLILHPITTYILLIIVTILLSGLFKLLGLQTTYNVFDTTKGELIQTTTAVENLFSFSGLKYIVGNASINFISFAPLSMYLVAAIGLAIAESSGFIDVLFKKIFSKMNDTVLTFIIILIATVSSLINEVGFVIIIPISALIFKSKKRNSVIGVCAAFAGCAFGYGTSIFIGSMETLVIPYTTTAARLIDSSYHVSLSSNLYIMIVSTIVLSIVGTIVIEKIISPSLAHYREKRNLDENVDMELIDDETIEQNMLSNDYNEKKGFKLSCIIALILVLLFIYSVIPNLPGSGLLLDYSEDTYLKQIFGEKSYFQDGFTFVISIIFIVTGLVYGFASKKFKSDKDVINMSQDELKKVGNMLLLLFVASQFIAIFKKTNIGTYITGVLANILSSFSFKGILYLIFAIILILISDFFVTGIQAKWVIFSPVIVPVLMQSNISPQFTQFVMRAVDSMANGITPLYAYFVIFIGYLNMYNSKNGKTITIGNAIRIMFPYFVIISLTWLLLLIGWYIIGLPIGPGVYPTI